VTWLHYSKKLMVGTYSNPFYVILLSCHKDLESHVSPYIYHHFHLTVSRTLANKVDRETKQKPAATLF